MSTDQFTSRQAALAAGYETNDKGIITSPGQFEGAPLYVPAFWEYVLENGEDWTEETENDEIYVFKLSREDREHFPVLADVAELRIWEDEQGFVHHELFTPPYGRMCRDPSKCRGKGYCPKDPTCGD